MTIRQPKPLDTDELYAQLTEVQTEIQRLRCRLEKALHERDLIRKLLGRRPLPHETSSRRAAEGNHSGDRDRSRDD